MVATSQICPICHHQPLTYQVRLPRHLPQVVPDGAVLSPQPLGDAWGNVCVSAYCSVCSIVATMYVNQQMWPDAYEYVAKQLSYRVYAFHLHRRASRLRYRTPLTDEQTIHLASMELPPAQEQHCIEIACAVDDGNFAIQAAHTYKQIAQGDSRYYLVSHRGFAHVWPDVVASLTRLYTSTSLARALHASKKMNRAVGVQGMAAEHRRDRLVEVRFYPRSTAEPWLIVVNHKRYPGNPSPAAVKLSLLMEHLTSPETGWEPCFVEGAPPREFPYPFGPVPPFVAP